MYAFAAVLAANIFGKKSVIVLGGVDAAKNPDLPYGIWLSPWRSVLVRYALKNADVVCAGDNSLKRSAAELAGYDGGNIVLLPPGFDSERWKPAGEKEQIVLTVAALHSPLRVRVKGIDTLIAAARILTNVRFVLIGVEEHLKGVLDVPENMTLLDLLGRDELLEHYRRAKIYCQPSVQEAVGYSLREAMLCGCIPVVSDVGGMRTAAGGIGVLVPPSNRDALVVAIQGALKMPQEISARARAHIVALYPLETRVTQLLKVIGEASS